MIGNSWDTVLNTEHMQKMLDWVQFKRDEGQRILPDDKDIFRAFELTPFEETKVVILGQDPYPGKDKKGEYHAMGMSFSSRSECEVPASLRNIFIELVQEIGAYNESADLTKWAKQGVLLLNTVLTVEADCPNSHKAMGWETLTNSAVKALGHAESPVVFMLWGRQAQTNEVFIRNDKTKLILKAAHPSPLSANRGFFGCNHFIDANSF